LIELYLAASLSEASAPAALAGGISRRYLHWSLLLFYHYGHAAHISV